MNKVQKNIIPIVFSFDKRMEMAAGVAITSLLLNAQQDSYYDIFILHSSKEDYSQSPLNTIPTLFPNCSISFRAVGNQFNGAYEVRGITEAAYYRIVIPDLIPEYDKVLYSDVDVIFLTDLRKYYNADLEGYGFAAVNAFPFLPENTRHYVENSLRIDERNGYFYDGNLIVNSKYLRSAEMVKKILDTAMSGKYLFQEMDAINLTCRGRIKPMDVSFCISTYIYDAISVGTLELDNSVLKKCIIHYNGMKPWIGACPNMDIWWNYYRKSIFYDESFTHDFWVGQRDALMRMPLVKRIKQLLRYPLDIKECRKYQ